MTRTTTSLPGTRRPRLVVLRGAVVLPDRVLEDGLVVAEGDRLAWVGPADDAPRDVLGDAALPHPTDHLLLPGLVDVHCHGGGGASFPDARTTHEARVAVAEHLAHGTTRLVASLVTAPGDVLVERAAVLAELADAGEVAGIHLEGPFLSPARCGAQDPSAMVDGDLTLVRDVVRAARGHLVTMTLAPEVPGVLGPGGVVAELVAVGAVPSFGHTDASADVVRTAIDEARRALAEALGPARSSLPTVTHLFNGMPPMHHRSPGPVAACLAAAARGDAVVELVADGVHLAPETVRAVFDVAAGHVVLVTDAMAATGVADGEHVLGGLRVVVADGVARLAEGGAIAGGTAHLLDVVRATVDAGVDLVAAVRAASVTPAVVLGRDDVGALVAGRRADVVVADRDLRPLDVLRDGRWVDRPLDLVPAPRAVVRTADAPFVLREGAGVRVPDGHAGLADVVHERLGRLTGRRTTSGDDVVLRLVDDVADVLGDDVPADLRAADVAARRGTPLDHAAGGAERAREAYRLDVGADRATVTALDVPGLLHGVTALGLLLARGVGGGADDGPAAAPAATVTDAPRYSWRGLSVDVARHPRTLPELLTLVDVLTDLRLNVLHLHLTDDQGWRVEVPSRPALTERSGATAVGGAPGGFLTVADWDRLTRHAAARGVTVVPEVDVPGHVNAALHAYGELTPTGEAPPAYTGTDVGFSRLHADLPATTPFLEDVLGDVAARTPGRYVHVGGDEVLTMEPDEYARLVRTAADVVERAGRTVVAWQEAAKAPLTPGSVVQVWDTRPDLGDVVRAAAAGARVVLSPAEHAYHDMRYDAGSPLGLDWAGHVPAPRALGWDPEAVVPGLDPAAVAGVEAAVWSETTPGLADVTWLLLPRLAATAEVAWSGAVEHEHAWDDHVRRLRAQTRTWDAAGLTWCRTPDGRWW